VELLPDAGHAEEDLRAELAQVFLDGAQALGEIHRRTHQHRDVDGEHLLGHVAQRQVGNQLVGVAAAEHAVEAARRRTQAAPGRHRRLRTPGAATGEHAQGGVVEGRRLQGSGLAGGVALLGLATHPQHFVEADEAGAVVAAQAALVDHHQGLQAGQPLAHLEHLVELLLVLADDHRGLGQRQQVLDLVRRRRGVDTRRHAAGHGDAHLREGPFLPVLRQDGHRFARLHAQRTQPQAEPARSVGVLGPADGLPDAVQLLPQRRALRQHARPVFELLRQRELRGIGVGHQLNQRLRRL